MLSHRAAWLRAIQRDTEGGATGRRGVVVMFGLFHMAGWYFIEDALGGDRPVHLVHRADPHELLGAVERWRASGLYCIPGGVAAHPRRRRHATTRRRWSRCSPGRRCVDARPHRRAEGALPRLVDVGRVRLHRDRPRRGAARLRPLRPARAASGSRRRWSIADLADDGELWLRGPTMFSGYLDRPDATAEAIDDDGWFHTGDLATRDADGYLTITGRRSESIRSGGEWVAPVEVESRRAHAPRGRGGGRGRAPRRRAGARWCARRSSCGRARRCRPSRSCARTSPSSLVGPKQPRVVVQVDELPRTDATGQIRRRRLRDTIASS